MVVDQEDDLTPFELENASNKMSSPSELNIETREKVRIKRINKESMGPEDYYYLKKFENKIGIILQVNECKSGVFTYKVEFNQNEFGYFYKDDFMLLNDDKPK